MAAGRLATHHSPPALQNGTKAGRQAGSSVMPALASLGMPADRPLSPLSPHLLSHPAAVNYRLRNEHLIKLSISHALAQSAKLSVYEERVMEIVESTKDLPETLAATGEASRAPGGRGCIETGGRRTGKPELRVC